MVTLTHDRDVKNTDTVFKNKVAEPNSTRMERVESAMGTHVDISHRGRRAEQ